MGHARRTIDRSDVSVSPPANDNDAGPGDTEADRWHWIIEKLKAIHTPAAVQAAGLKLSGMSVDAFGRLLRQTMKTLDWPHSEGLKD